MVHNPARKRPRNKNRNDNDSRNNNRFSLCATITLVMQCLPPRKKAADRYEDRNGPIIYYL
jgi:hypothetical protein